MINYFAGWCPPCRAELPAFETVHRDLESEVQFIGISRDTDVAAWQQVVDDFDLSFLTVFEGQLGGSLGAVDGWAMPTTVFVDANGDIREVHSGALDEVALRARIEQHLSGKS